MIILNEVTVSGHLTKDPELRVTQNGNSVVTLNLATNEKWTDKQGNKQESVEYHKIVFWGKQAETINQYCKKRHGLYVEGSLTTREWEKDGVKRYSTEIKGIRFQFGDKPKENQSQQGNYNQGGQNKYNDQVPPNHLDQDVPF